MNTKGHCYPKYIIFQAVYFKLRFTLSYQDIAEIMKMHGVQVRGGWSCASIFAHSLFNIIAEDSKAITKGILGHDFSQKSGLS
jgi:hypothetical protein